LPRKTTVSRILLKKVRLEIGSNGAGGEVDFVEAIPEANGVGLT
jgi:hypothetical protein